MKKTIFFIFFLLVLSTNIQVFAVRATPFPITITQADGTEITYSLKGDEFFNYKQTLDGYLLVLNSAGILNYAKVDNTGNIVSTTVKARQISDRLPSEKQFLTTLKPNFVFPKPIQKSRLMRSASVSKPQKTFPITGQPKSLVILVNFSDVSFKTANTKTSFTNLLNQSGYNVNGGTGSAKDYFRDNSKGVFNPQFDVYGPYTLLHPMDFYGKNLANGEDQNPEQMVIDGCGLAAADGVNFSQYDTNHDGVVDNVFIYYAGFNEAEGAPANSIWPHRFALNNYNTKFNNVAVNDYACTSELKGSIGSTMCGIGTFCHEFGHVLGLDDMYVTDANVTDHYTLQNWDIMDSGPYLNGGKTPPFYSSYERFYLNWLIPIELKTAQNVTLDTLSSSNKAYLISQNGNHNLNGKNPTPVEFFLLENRQKKGWDTYLPGHGLLITHIYYNPSTWASNTPNNDINAMGVDIVEADGIGSEGTMSGDPFPGTSSVTSYSPILRSSINISKPLSYITEVNGIIKFRFKGGGNIPTITSIGTPTEFATVQGTPSALQTITVGGLKLVSDITLSFDTNLHFEMKKESDSNWQKIINLTPSSIDSIVSATKIQIRYNPAIPSYKYKHVETLYLTATNADTVSVNLIGNSARPVYVTAPVATSATDVKLESFISKWNPVADATGYYLTSYNVASGTSNMTQGFKNGLIPANGWTITATGTMTSTVYSGDSVPAIQFKNTGEYVQTELYELPTSALSFFVKSLGENNGALLIEAWNGINWAVLQNLPITGSLKTFKTIDLDTVNHFNRFRFFYTKSVGSDGSVGVIIDDVTAKFAKSLIYDAKDKWVTNTQDTTLNIIPGRDYYYKVKASDKTLYTDGTLKYENITSFSNQIHVYLFYDSISKFVNKYKSLTLYRDNSGMAVVVLPNTNSEVNVYTTIGQLVQTINPTDILVPIKNLRKGQVYLVQSGKYAIKFIY